MSRKRTAVDAEPEVLGGIPTKPERLFDHTKQVVAIDLKALHELPFDPEASGTKSLRAFFFPMGNVTHVDNAPGKFVVNGVYGVENALSIVYFDDGKLQSPELLISFIDHGTANAAQTGISVESLPLPLLKAKGRYENMSVFRPIAEVVGFSSLPGGLPWTVTLVPALKGLTQKLGYSFVALGIKDEASLTAFVNEPLADRIPRLFAAAADRLKVEVSEQEGQCARTAQKVLTKFTAKLEALQNSFKAADLSGYDEPLESRIIQMPTDDSGDTLLSPIRRQQLDNGEALLIRTTHYRASGKPSPIKPSPIKPPTPERDKSPPAEPTPPHSPMLSEGLLEDKSSPPNLRARHEPKVAEPKPKPAVKVRMVMKSTRAPRVKALPSGAASRIGCSNGRGGMYTREAYDTPAVTSASSLKKVSSLLTEESTKAHAFQVSAIITALKVEVASLTAANLSLVAQLSAQSKSNETQVLSARLEERGLIAEAVSKSFQNGMNAAIRIRKDQEVVYRPVSNHPPSSAQHQASSSSKKRNRHVTESSEDSESF